MPTERIEQTRSIGNIYPGFIAQCGANLLSLNESAQFLQVAQVFVTEGDGKTFALLFRPVTFKANARLGVPFFRSESDNFRQRIPGDFPQPHAIPYIKPYRT